MVIYLRPGSKIRVVAVLALVLTILGARVGLILRGDSAETAARISPLGRINTSQPNVGIMVDVAQARPEDVNSALAVLDTVHWRATWFLDATTVEAHPELVKDIVSRGHEVGLKGTDQKPLNRLSQVEVKDRIMRAREALAKVGVEPVPFLYPPLGRYSDTVVIVAFQEGCQAVKPGFDASAMRGKEDQASSKMAASLKPGDLILLRVGRTGLSPAERYLASLEKSLVSHGLSGSPLTSLVKGVK